MSVLHHRQNSLGSSFASHALDSFALHAQNRRMGRPRTSIRTSIGKPLNRLAELRERAGLSQEALAEMVGCSAGQISRYESGGQPPFMATFVKIVHALGVKNPATLLGATPPAARLIGDVGAGAVIIPVDDEHEFIDVPPGLNEPFAVRVTGTSMIPAYRDGDVLICDVHPVNSREILNKDCVVLTTDGRRLVKKVLPGTRDTVQLLSYETQEAEAGVQLQSAAIVRWVKRG